MPLTPPIADEGIPLTTEPEEAVGSDPAPSAPAPSGDLESIRLFLLELVPEAGAPITWCDTRGVVYESPPLLPARRQVVLGEHARVLFERFRAVLAENGGRSGQVGPLIAAVVRAASTDLLDVLDEAFAVALPDQLSAARIRPDDRPSDLFPAEEMLKAILPFYARPVTVVLGLGDVAKLSR